VDPALRQVVLIFVEELREQLAAITQALSAMEIEEVFRQAHSWKGSASSLGLDDLATLAHDFESALTPVRRGAAPLTPELLDAALAALDAASARIPGLIAESDEGASEVASATAALRALTGEQVDVAPVSSSEPVREAEPAVDPATESVRVTVARLTALERGLDDLRGLRSRLESQAEGAAGAVHTVDQLWRAARDGHRVEPGALFALLSRLRGMRRALVDDAETLQSHVVATDETLRTMRMVPASNLGEPLGRALRDACKKTGKEARLVIDGGDVQLDRHVLEELKGPLLHIVRNAVDHGVEAPEVREAIGKPARARVTVAIRQELRTLHVEVGDDGRGVDVEAVREKARARGLVAGDEELDEAQTIDLLFRSGFSTADEVTELSGRGVGLDVVRDAATRLGGSVSMTTAIGRGSTVRLAVPLTIAAAEGIVVEERGRRFALPLAQVERVVRATAAELRDDGAHVVFDLDDEPLPIARLSALLDAPPLAGKSAVVILVARAGERRVGVACERLVGQRELLLRPLPPELATLDHVSGVALLPSGEAIFVLAAAALARQAAQRRPAAATATAARERSVLICDDSITIRSLLRHSLEAAGFRVRTAADGEEALQLAALERFDLVVADVRMPRVDGLQLTTRLRSSPRTARLPVVLFSSLASSQDREAGRAAGASAYLSKREFDRGELVDVIAQLLKERA